MYLLINSSTPSPFHVLFHSLAQLYIYFIIYVFTKSIPHLTHPLVHLFMVFNDVFWEAGRSNYHHMLNDCEFPFENVCMRKWLWPNCNIISRYLSGGVGEKHEIFQVG